VAGAVVGVGVDAVEIARVRHAITRTPALLARVWTPQERRRCTTADGRWRVPELAARFAAKEAVAKALGTGIAGFAFCDVEVVPDRRGKPEIVLHRGAAEVAAARGVADLQASLSTSAELGLAFVVAQGSRAPGPVASG